MFIAPVEVMVGKKIYAHAKLCSSPKLRRIRQLAMLQRKAVIRVWVRLQRRAKFFQDQLCGLIAIGVGVDLQTGLKGQMQQF